MRKKKVLELVLEELKLDNKIFKILKDNNINIVEDVWMKTRKELKSFGLTDADISQISIKLQLYGIDLNKKIYQSSFLLTFC